MTMAATSSHGLRSEVLGGRPSASRRAAAAAYDGSSGRSISCCSRLIEPPVGPSSVAVAGLGRTGPSGGRGGGGGHAGPAGPAAVRPADRARITAAAWTAYRTAASR